MSIQLQNVIGLPPSSYISDNPMINSFPVAEFMPGEPEFQAGLTVFKVMHQPGVYLDILEEHGFTIQTPIKLAFLADNFPTDSFRNEYGSHFLESVTNVVSEQMQSLMQTLGARTATEGVGNLSEFLKSDQMGKFAGVIGGGLDTGLRGIETFKKGLEGAGAGGVGDMLDRVLAGARIDFPQIWKGSGFAPSYTMTVRLYNPMPGSDTATERYIIGPLAAILTLALPQTDDDGTYQWPFFHDIKCKGMFHLNPAVITNITVVKGGDQQQIAFNQKLSIVDVRLDISGLFQTMLLETENANPYSDRPTLAHYLQNLRDKREILNPYEVPASMMAFASASSNTESVANQNLREPQIARLQEPSISPTSSPNDPVQSRVSSTSKDRYNSIA